MTFVQVFTLLTTYVPVRVLVNARPLPLVKDAARSEMISGVNLYMLVSAFGQRGRLPLERLVEKIMGDGQRSIRDVRKMFLLAAAGER